ncbi:hypothetical protein SprV_0100503600 [Sparganum proliferum]
MPPVPIQLLNVRRRLRLLCGLPDSDSPPVASSESEERGATTATVLRSLFSHLRATCLPFLRIAAFIMQEITNIDVPASHCQPSADKSVDEFTLLLAYLGLPLGPEDLLTVLSTECADDMEEPSSMKCKTSSPSSPLCLARLITSWCLVGRSSASRNLYVNLRKRFLPQTTTVPTLLPEPQISVPHLIRLPREYVRLLALADEWKKKNTESRTPCYPSLCLACGAVASFAYEKLRPPKQSAFVLRPALRLEHHICDMQVHVGRNHAGYAFILLLQSGILLLLCDQAPQIIRFPEVYRDALGQPDVDLRRGTPLFLDEVAYWNLTGTWLKHEATQSIPE